MRSTLQGWDRLWLLLAAITVNKCKRWNRHFRTRSRDVGHEVSFGPQSEDSGNGHESPAGEPTPEEVVLLTELVENLLRGLPAESRPILSLALEGCSVAQIVEQAGRSQRSVYRVLSQVKETLERLAAEGPATPERSPRQEIVTPLTLLKRQRSSRQTPPERVE